jgi:hypothetical protein
MNLASFMKRMWFGCHSGKRSSVGRDNLQSASGLVCWRSGRYTSSPNQKFSVIFLSVFTLLGYFAHQYNSASFQILPSSSCVRDLPFDASISILEPAKEISVCLCLDASPTDRLCGLVVRLPGCRPRGPGFGSQPTRFSE